MPQAPEHLDEVRPRFLSLRYVTAQQKSHGRHNSRQRRDQRCDRITAPANHKLNGSPSRWPPQPTRLKSGINRPRRTLAYRNPAPNHRMQRTGQATADTGRGHLPRATFPNSLQPDCDRNQTQPARRHFRFKASQQPFARETSDQSSCNEQQRRQHNSQRRQPQRPPQHDPAHRHQQDTHQPPQNDGDRQRTEVRYPPCQQQKTIMHVR